MKHVSPDEVSAEVRAKGPTRRAVAKQQTRAKVLAAARRLFSEHGYEGATIRDIATAAGMSTGAVFANFSDKADLFREIMSVDIERLTADMREAAARARNLEEALLKIFTAGYAYYGAQMPMARAAFSVSWSPDEGAPFRKLDVVSAVQNVMLEQLNAAVARGELGQEAEVKLRAQMLFESYASNFTFAIFQGWTLDALAARARDQIRILLAGARRG
jgi:AcrR family transcriptional regulator